MAANGSSCYGSNVASLYKPGPMQAGICAASNTLAIFSTTALTLQSTIGLTVPGTTTLNGTITGTGWASPPALGGTTPAAAVFSTLSATNTVTLSPASHGVTISPSGSGTVTINPASTAGNINNMAIGQTTTAAGSFTTLSASNSAVNFPGLSSSSAAQTGTVCWTTGTGNLTVDTTTTCLLSLEELKDIRGPITGALDEVMALKPFWFSWKLDTPERSGDANVQPGLGAHATEKVDHRLAAYTPDGKLKGVRYQEMVALLVAAVQEQQKEIDDLKARLK